MENNLSDLRKELRAAADPQKAKDLQRFFKTGPGEYAEGDFFLGVMVPQTRMIIERYWRDISLPSIKIMLASKFHEERLSALLVLVKKFESGGQKTRQEIFNLYLANTRYINNWDLVDCTAPKIVGVYLEDKERTILRKLAKSKNIWERRIAMLAAFRFIQKGDPGDALKIAEILADDREDLIRKAVGWMLREIGKRCGQEIEEEFLLKHYQKMPRIMLRYAIEQFGEEKRKYYLNLRPGA